MSPVESVARRQGQIWEANAHKIISPPRTRAQSFRVNDFGIPSAPLYFLSVINVYARRRGGFLFRTARSREGRDVASVEMIIFECKSRRAARLD
jgi:hypothetical protein